MTLVEFLRARLDEDEAAAKAWLPFGNPDAAARNHVARHDPGRVLREVTHKRTILERHDWWFNRPAETDAEQHARCTHPDYEYATTQGQRKMWDCADVPPYGDDGEPDHSWERNVEEGRDGWERFDYTEESYWRRRLPPEKAAEKRSLRERPPRELLELAAVYADHEDYDEAWRP